MAGRSVGHIEVTVDAATGKLKAQVTKASKEAGEAGGKALEEGLSDISGRELVAKIKGIREEVKRTLAGIAVDIQIGSPQSELQRLQAQLRAAQIELFLTPEVDDEDLQVMLAEMRLRLKAATNPIVDVDPVLTDRELGLLVAEAQATLKTTQLIIEARVDIETLDEIAKAKAELEAFEAEQLEFRAGGIDLTELNKDLRQARFEAEHERWDITTRLPTGSLKAEFARIKAEVEADVWKIAAEFQRADAERQIREFTEEVERRDLAVNLALETAKAAAEMDQWRMHHGERLHIPLDPNLAEATVAFDAWLRRQEAKGINVKTDPETVRATIAFESWINEMQRNTLQVVLDLQTREAERKAALVKAKIEREGAIDLALKLAVDTARASVDLRVWREKNGEPLNLPLEPDVLAATIRFNAWLREQEAKGINVDVDPDTVRATIEFESWVMRMQGRQINVGVDVDTGLASGKAKAFMSELESAADSGGRGISARWKAIIAGIVTLAEPAGVALEGALSASVSVVSSAFSALAGSAGAAVPVLAGMGATIPALIVGMEGMGDALGAVNDEFAAAVAEGRAFDINTGAIQAAMKNLSPAAQDFVESFAAVRGVFDDIRARVQQELFAGLGTSLDKLAGTTIPSVGASLELAADSLNGFFRDLADASVGIDFKDIFADVKPAVDAVFDAIVSLFQTFEPFMRAATPAANKLAESFRKSADSLREMVEAGEESGALGKFLDEGVTSLKIWWNLLRNVGDALVTLFDAGKDSGDTFVQSLADMVERWDEWMESVQGQEALADFFALGQQVMEDLKPVLEGLQGFFDNLISEGAVDRFGELAESLGEALPLLGTLLELVGRTQVLQTMVDLIVAIGDALEPALPALQELADAIGVSLGDAVIAITPLLEALAGVITQLAEFLAPISDLVVGIGLAFLTWKAIGGMTGNVVTSLGKVQTSIGKLSEAAAYSKLAAGEMVTGFAKMDFSKVSQGAKVLGPALLQTGKSAGAAAGVAVASALGIAFGAQMVAEGDDMSQKVMGVMTIIGSAVTAFAVGGPIVGGLALAMGGVTALFQASAAEAKKAAAEIDEYTVALEQMLEVGGEGAVAETILENLRGETDETRDGFIAMGFSIDDWAEKMASGTTSASEGMASMLETVGPAGEQLAEMLRAGTISADDLANAFSGEGFTNPAIIPFLADVKGELDGANVSADDAKNMFDALRDEENELGLGSQEMGRRHAEAAAGMDLANSAANLFEQRVAGLSDTVGYSALAADDAAGSIDLMKESANQAADLFEARVADMDLVTDAFNDMKDAAEDSAESADLLRESWDLLFGAAMRAQEAGDAWAESVQAVGELVEKEAEAEKELNDARISGAEDVATAQSKVTEAQIKLNEAREDGDPDKIAAAEENLAQAQAGVTTAQRESADAIAEATKEYDDAQLSLERWTEAGREGREVMRTMGEAAVADAAGMIEQGKGTDKARQALINHREQMIKQAMIFGKTREEAERYVNQLGFTPENIETLINTPGLTEAETGLADLKTQADEMPGAKVVIWLEGVKEAMLGLDGVKGGGDDLSRKEARLKVRQDGIEAVMLGLDGIKDSGDEISRQAAVAAVESEGVPTTNAALQTVINKANELDGKTATVTAIAKVVTDWSGLEQSGLVHGGQVGRDPMIAGETGPELIRLGKLHGLLMSPAFMPPGTMVTSAALTAAKMRNAPRSAMTMSALDLRELVKGRIVVEPPKAGKTVNNYLTVTPSQADPEAVAQSVINRAAVLAAR